MTLAEGDARFMRSLLAASDDCIKVLSLDGKLAFMSEGGQRVMEVSDFNAIKGCPWPDFWQGEGNADAIAAVRSAREGRSARFQGAANTTAGTPRYWDVQVSPILGPDGKPESILSVSRDITALKEAQERQALLGQELAHRMKNTIAMIQAIANQTLRPGESIEVAKAAFLARLSVLGAAQDLLTQQSWAKASLHHLVAATLAPSQSERFKVSGPEIELSSKCALALALSIHELATNATKYGALSNESGQVEVWWGVDGAPEARQFHFHWRESGGPTVTAPSHKGFGSRMIERALASSFSGTSQVDHRPSGVVFTLVSPLDALTTEA